MGSGPSIEEWEQTFGAGLLPHRIGWSRCSAATITAAQVPEQSSGVAWPCSRLADLLSPELRHMGPG